MIKKGICQTVHSHDLNYRLLGESFECFAMKEYHLDGPTPPDICPQTSGMVAFSLSCKLLEPVPLPLLLSVLGRMKGRT